MSATRTRATHNETRTFPSSFASAAQPDMPLDPALRAVVIGRGVEAHVGAIAHPSLQSTHDMIYTRLEELPCRLEVRARWWNGAQR